MSNLLDVKEADAGVGHEVEGENLHDALPSRALRLAPEPNPMGSRNWSILSIRASSKAGKRQAGGVM